MPSSRTNSAEDSALKSPQISHGPVSCRVSRRSVPAAIVREAGSLAGKCVLPSHIEPVDRLSLASRTERGSAGSVPS
jgi:hypothetical protein